jgi:hypothetical protein
VPHQGRLLKPPGLHEFGEYLPVNPGGHLLVLVAFGLAETDQVENVDHETVGEQCRDVAPQHRSGGGAVHEHDWGTGAEQIPRDLAVRCGGAPLKGPGGGVRRHWKAPVRLGG